MAQVKGRVEIGEEGGITLTLPKGAIIKNNGDKAILSVPKGQDYDGYRYEVPSDCVSDVDEKTIKVALTEWEGDNLEIHKGTEMEELVQPEIVDMFSKAKDADFITEWCRVEVPTAACKSYSSSVRVRMPDNTGYADKFTFIPNVFIKDKESDETVTVFSVPDTIKFSVGTNADDKEEITAQTLSAVTKDGKYEKREGNGGRKWEHIEVPVEARAFENEKSSRFNMPKGEYDGCSYYLPNGMVKESETPGNLTLALPADWKVNVIDVDKSKMEMDVSQLKGVVEGKGKESYRVYRKGVPVPEEQTEKQSESEKTI